MPVFSKSKRVRRYDVFYYERGYVDPSRETFQDLIEETKLFGIVIWRKVLDSEYVPQHAIIALGATGTAGWTSKFKEYM